jgi:putative hemolysin
MTKHERSHICRQAGSAQRETRISRLLARHLAACPPSCWEGEGSRPIGRAGRSVFSVVISFTIATQGTGGMMKRVLFGICLALLSQAGFAVESQIVVSAERAIFCLDSGGNLKWSFYHPFIYYSNSSPAIGNIDNSAEAEIVVAAVDLYCFNYDGTVRWSFASDTTMHFCSPVIANVDTVGRPEVLIGTNDTLYCLDSNGDMKWAVEVPGNYTRGYVGPAITVANVDAAGTPEVLVATPGSFYCVNANGTLKWSYDMTGAINAWYSFPGIAVADLDADNVPEIVVTQSNEEFLVGHSSTVYCLRPDGSLKWEITDSSYVSQPAIADINNDGKPEIVFHFSGRSPKIVAAFQENTAGTGIDLVWETAIVDDTPSSVPFPVICDIDGDSDKDVLWVGHTNTANPSGVLYVMNGLDGKHPDNSGNPCYTNSNFFSRTVCERGVAVADIDNDGRLEIVGISSDADCVYGVCALECDSWAEGRNMYTSHLYHTTDVEEELIIPRIEPNNWETHNTWATQLSTGGTGFGTPTVKWSYYNSGFERLLSSIAIAPVYHSVGIEDTEHNMGTDREHNRVRAYYDRGQVKVAFTLSSRENISFRILDVVGRERENLPVGSMSKGKHQRCMDVRSLENGVYFVQTHVGSETFGSKVIVLR